MLSKESCAIDLVRDALAHLKVIGVDRGSQARLRDARVEEDTGIGDISDTVGFIAAARTRQWDREGSVRTLVLA